jgi:hypothetical protein
MLGVIPAAGRATRFGGIFKELLPIGEDEYLLDHAIRQSAALGADHALVVTRIEKRPWHESHVYRHVDGVPVDFIEQRHGGDLWGAIRTTFPLREKSILVMPDTVFACDGPLPDCDLAFGVFVTDTPERFSIVEHDRIITKQPAEGKHLAWGCVWWSERVIDHWEQSAFTHYDRAFESAMQRFGYTLVPITQYCDLGTWASYQSYVREAT